MIQQVRDIETLSADWELTRDQRIDLYLKCAAALAKENDNGNAFRVYFHTFKYIHNEKGDFKTHAEQLIISAFRAPQIINIEEVLLFDAV